MFKKILFFSSLVISLSACERLQANHDAFKASAANAPTSASGSKQPVKNLLLDRETLIAAKNSLQNMPAFTGKTVQVFGNIDFYDGVRPRIELAVQRPDNTDDIWLLRFEHGQWSQPVLDEEEEMNAAQMAKFLTPLSNIHFEDATHAATLWKTKAKEVQAVWQEPYHTAFIWMPKLKKRFWHTAEIEAQGAQYYLSLNLDGTIWEWKRIRE